MRVEPCKDCIALPVCMHKDPLSIVEKCDYILMYWIRTYALYHTVLHTNGHENLIYSKNFRRLFAMTLASGFPQRDYALNIREVPIDKKEIKEIGVDDHIEKYPQYVFPLKHSLGMYVQRLKNGTL